MRGLLGVALRKETHRDALRVGVRLDLKEGSDGPLKTEPTPEAPISLRERRN